MICSMSRAPAMRERKAAPPRRVQTIPVENFPCHNRIAASTNPGAATNRQRNRIRRSKGPMCSRCFAERRGAREAESLPLPGVGSDSIFLHPAIERSTAQAQSLRRMADVAPRASQRLADEDAFHRFEAEFIETLAG